MNTSPLIILASARHPSDTQSFAATLLADTPHEVVNLLHAEVHPYRYGGAYPPGDEFLSIIKRVHQHQVLIVATPVYWYAMSGLLKTFFDRLTDLTTVAKPLGRQLRGKRLLALAVGAEPTLPPGFEVPFAATAAYFGMSFGGSLYHCTKQPAPAVDPAARAAFLAACSV